ncbi:putative phage repressor [uncultured Pleomorphomonas sp.]|uniref:Putative phage repressor n=1 Tax=uncultured Pleomorphomonas sp. TaxID=442121 RepID=A0A212L797_9HYPH|nr:S24 family peptidase [uncultured Pleomorphomonas sp.]SCM73452.1 putative phage repressor [uncultured Pleomorphomonas sp.]
MTTDLKSFVESRLALLGRSPADANRVGGFTRTFVNDILNGRKKNVRGDNLLALAKALDCSPEDILDAQTAGEKGDGIRLVDIPMPAHLNRDIPILGTAMGSVIDDDFHGFVLDGRPIDYARRPPGLAGATDIYALYVEGESMFPAFPAGSLCFVQPRRSPAIGDAVIVQTKHWDGDPGQAYIKVLVRRTSDKIVLKQYNPEATIEIPNKYVESIHKVLTTRELFGV